MAVPEATGAQVSQEVADVKRGICEAEVIKIYDKNPLTMEEQLAGLESPVSRAIRVGLKRLQACRQLVRESLCRFRLGQAVGSDLCGPLACPLRLFSPRARGSRRSACGGVPTCQGIRRDAQLFTGDDHIEDLAADSPH